MISQVKQFDPKLQQIQANQIRRSQTQSIKPKKISKQHESNEKINQQRQTDQEQNQQQRSNHRQQLINPQQKYVEVQIHDLNFGSQSGIQRNQQIKLPVQQQCRANSIQPNQIQTFANSINGQVQTERRNSLNQLNIQNQRQQSFLSHASSSLVARKSPVKKSQTQIQQLHYHPNQENNYQKLNQSQSLVQLKNLQNSSVSTIILKNFEESQCHQNHNQVPQTPQRVQSERKSVITKIQFCQQITNQKASNHTHSDAEYAQLPSFQEQIEYFQKNLEKDPELKNKFPYCCMQRGKLITKITRLRNSPEKRSKTIKPSIRGSPSIDNSYYNNNSSVFDTSQQIANISGVQRQSLLLQTLVSGKELKSTQSSNFKKSVIQNREQIIENNEKEKSGKKKNENQNSQYNSENQDQEKTNLENIENQFQYSDEKQQGQGQNLDDNQNYSQINDFNFQNQKTPENQNFQGKQKSIINLTNEHNISYSPITKIQTSQKKQLSPGQGSNLLKVNYIQSTQKIYQENQDEEYQQNNITSFVDKSENQDNQKNENQIFEEQFEESQQDPEQKELEQNKVENINYQQQQDQQENNYQILNSNNQTNNINNDSQNISEQQQQFNSNQKSNFDSQQKIQQQQLQQSSSQINDELDQEIKKIENLLIQIKNKKLKCQEILKESLQKLMELENLPENIQNIVKKKIEGFQSQQSDIESINENYDLNISNFLNNSVNQNQIKSILKQKLDQIDKYMREQEIFQEEAQFYQNLYSNQKIMQENEKENEKKSQEQSQNLIQQEQSLKFQEYLQIQQQEQSKKEKEQELKMQKIQEQMQNQIQEMMGQNLQQFLDNFNLVQKQQLEAQQQIIKEHQEQQKLMAQQMEEQMQKYKNQQDILQNYKEIYDQLKSKQEELNNQLVQNMEDKKNLQEQSQNNSLQILEKEKKENEEKIRQIQELQNQILQKIDMQQQFNKQELQQYLNKIEEQKFDMQQGQQKNDQIFLEQKEQIENEKQSQVNLQQKEKLEQKQNLELVSKQMEPQLKNYINKDNNQQQSDQGQQTKLKIDGDQQNQNDKEILTAENIAIIDQNDSKPQLDEQIISQELQNQNGEIIESQDYYLQQQHQKLKENKLHQQESQVSDLLLEKTDNTNLNYNDKNINNNENENDEYLQNNQKETEKLFSNSNNNIDQNTYIQNSNQDDYCQGSQLQDNYGNKEEKQQQNFDETLEKQQQQNQQQQEQSNEQEQQQQLQELQNNSTFQQEQSFEQNNQMQEQQQENQIELNQQSFQQNDGNEIDNQYDQNMLGQDQQQQEQLNFNQQEDEQQNLNQNIIDKENKQIIQNKNDETLQKSVEKVTIDQQQQNLQEKENEIIYQQEQENEQQQQQQQMLQKKNQNQKEQNQSKINIQNQKQKYSLHEITAKTTPDQTPKSFSKQEFKEIYNEYMQNPIVASQQRILNQLKRVQDEQNYNQLHRCSPSKSLPNFNQVNQYQQQTQLEKELFMKNIQQIFESMKERQKRDKQKLNFRHNTQNNLIAPQDTEEIGKLQQDYSQIENEDELRSDAIDYELQQNNQISSNNIEQKCDQNYISNKNNEKSQQKQIQQNSFQNIEENSLNQSVKNFESFKTSEKKLDIKKAHIDFSQQKFKKQIQPSNLKRENQSNIKNIKTSTKKAKLNLSGFQRINNFNFEKNNSMTQTMPSWKIRHENSKQNSINRMQKSNKSQGRVNQQKIIEVSRNHNDYLTDFGRCVDKNIQQEILKKNLIIENPEDFDLIDKLVIYQKSLEDMGQLGYKVGKILAKSNNQSKYSSVNQIQSFSQIIN